MRDEKTKADFIKYLEAHPELRFWQAVRNWSGYGYVLVSNTLDGDVGDYQDTFYWEGPK